MAEVTITVKTEIAQAERAIKDAKKQLDELTKAQQKVTEGGKLWKALAAEIDTTKNKIDDLTDSTKLLQGSGVERLTSSFSTLKEGFASWDTGKITGGLKGIGAAMKAIPIFLIIEGVMKLVENFDELKDSGGILGKVFTAIGEAIDWVSDKLEEFSDWIMNVDTDLKRLAETSIQTNKDLMQSTKERYDSEIALAAAAGKSTLGLEAEKARATIESIDKQMQGYIQLANVKGELSKKEKEQLEALGKERTKALQEEQVAQLKFYKEIDDAIKKQEELEKEQLKKRIERGKEWAKNKEANEKLLADLEYQAWKDNYERTKKEQEDADKAALEAKNKQFEEEQKIKKYWDDIFKAENDKINAQVEADAKLRLERQFQAEANYMGALQALSDVFFMTQLESAEGNEAAMNEIRKKQFNVDKALKATQATIDGIKAVNATIAQGGAFAIPLAISTGVLAAANVVKILATKFNPSSSGARPSAGSTPRLNTNTSNVTPQQQTLPGQGGTFIKPDNKVYVSEKEINDTRNRKARVEEQAVF